MEGSTYYLTFRTARGPEGAPVPLSIEEQKLVLEHIREGHEKFYTLIAVVVMPDHVHIILTPMDEYKLSRIMKGIKGVSARKINLSRTDKNACSTGSIWQDESYDRIVRDEKDFMEKMDYMFNNPVKAGLIDDPLSYHGWYYNEGFDKEESQEEQGSEDSRDSGDRQECLSHQVCYSEIWGLREEKNDWLSENEVITTKWETLRPTSPFYFFVSREEKGREVYEKYWKVTDIFPVNVTGIVTARDKFVIDFDKGSLRARIMTFRNKDLPDEVVKDGLRLKENYMWRVSKARKELMAIDDWQDYFTKILYRPFDIRHICFHDSVVWRTRKEVMRHMIQENLALCIGRAGQVVGSEKLWNIVFCSDCIEDFNLFYRGGNVNFPLYLHPDTNKRDLFTHTKEPEKRQPNISPKLLATLSNTYKVGQTFLSDPANLSDTSDRQECLSHQIFYYIYAVLYSNSYRTKYVEFLKSDFPRIPFTKDYQLFCKMGEYGKRLVDLHLLKSVELDPPVAKFQGEGDERVEKLRYEEETKRVYVNPGRYFEGVSKEVWQYQIGGYQVCNKWLKDRKGRRLSLEDIKHYCRIVTSLEKTIEVQSAIDGVYSKVEKETVEFPVPTQTMGTR